MKEDRKRKNWTWSAECEAVEIETPPSPFLSQCVSDKMKSWASKWPSRPTAQLAAESLAAGKKSSCYDVFACAHLISLFVCLFFVGPQIYLMTLFPSIAVFWHEDPTESPQSPRNAFQEPSNYVVSNRIKLVKLLRLNCRCPPRQCMNTYDTNKSIFFFFFWPSVL